MLLFFTPEAQGRITEQSRAGRGCQWGAGLAGRNAVRPQHGDYTVHCAVSRRTGLWRAGPLGLLLFPKKSSPQLLLVCLLRDLETTFPSFFGHVTKRWPMGCQQKWHEPAT